MTRLPINPKARALVIHRQPWPPAWKKVAVHLCMLARKDLLRPIYESQEHIARDLNMGTGSYPLAERALGRDGFHDREKIDPGGHYPNNHPAPAGGRVLRLRQEWFDRHANDPIPPKRGRKTVKASGRLPSSVAGSGPKSGTTCPPDRVQAPARRDEPLDEEKAERAALSQELRRWAATDDELRERLRGVDLATEPLELLRGMRDEATDLLGSPKAEVVTDPVGSLGTLPPTDPSRSPIRADHQDTERKELRGEDTTRREESPPSPGRSSSSLEIPSVARSRGSVAEAPGVRPAFACGSGSGEVSRGSTVDISNDPTKHRESTDTSIHKEAERPRGRARHQNDAPTPTAHIEPDPRQLDLLGRRVTP